ncbi:MAG: hypothetical protein QXU99_00265 [Candidatus Bathyarchaeia archaeon]
MVQADNTTKSGNDTTDMHATPLDVSNSPLCTCCVKMSFNRLYSSFTTHSFKGFSAIEISKNFKYQVIDIAKTDSNVQILLNEDYNITVIKPIIKSVVAVDGSVTIKSNQRNRNTAKRHQKLGFNVCGHRQHKSHRNSHLNENND